MNQSYVFSDMARTKRARAKALNQRTAELKKKVVRGKKYDLSFIPKDHVSRKKAMRKWKLNEYDLSQIEDKVSVGTQRREGLFYPIEAIRLLAQSKDSESRIHLTMIPEVFVRRQVSKNLVNLDQLRPLGEFGSCNGQKGRKTYFYTPEVLENMLGIKIIKRGDNFIPAKIVPGEMKTDRPPPVMAMKGYADEGPYCSAELCYIGSNVNKLKDLGFDKQSVVKKCPPRLMSVNLTDLGNDGSAGFSVIVDQVGHNDTVDRDYETDQAVHTPGQAVDTTVLVAAEPEDRFRPGFSGLWQDEIFGVMTDEMYDESDQAVPELPASQSVLRIHGLD